MQLDEYNILGWACLSDTNKFKLSHHVVLNYSLFFRVICGKSEGAIYVKKSPTFYQFVEQQIERRESFETNEKEKT